MATTHTDPGLHLRPMVHVDDLAVSIAFYERLGGEVIHGGPDTDWVLMQLGNAQVILLTRPPDPTRGESPVQLTFDAGMPLEELADRLRVADPVSDVITDRAFGDHIMVRTPDGLLLRISRREPDVLL